MSSVARVTTITVRSETSFEDAVATASLAPHRPCATSAAPGSGAEGRSHRGQHHGMVRDARGQLRARLRKAGCTPRLSRMGGYSPSRASARPVRTATNGGRPRTSPVRAGRARWSRAHDARSGSAEGPRFEEKRRCRGLRRDLRVDDAEQRGGLPGWARQRLVRRSGRKRQLAGRPVAAGGDSPLSDNLASIVVFFGSLAPCCRC